MFKLPIRIRMLLVILLNIIVLVTLLGTLNFLRQRAIIIDLERDLSLSVIDNINSEIVEASVLASALADPNDPEGSAVQLNTVDTRIPELLEGNFDFIAVVGNDGFVHSSSELGIINETIAELANFPDDETAFQALPVFDEVLVTSQTFDTRFDNNLPDYQIVVGAAIEPINQRIQEGIVNSLILVVVGTVISSVVVYLLLQRTIVSPIANLATIANSVQQGNLALRAEVTNEDEIGNLAASFNSMTDQLASSINNLEKRVEERTADLVIARDEAQRANDAKTAFLASTSHELRTPLNAVINYSKLIASGHWGDVTPQQTDALNTISKNGRYLLNLINDLLDMSKIVAGSLEIFKGDVDLNAEIQEVIKIGQGLIESDKVKFITEIQPNLPPTYGDGVRIRQIMINMVSNACKFTDEGHVRLVASVQNGTFLFKVEDTGIGIKPEDYDAVFASFQQTESGLLKGKGTGLGMSISKNLAEQHDGDLWFESTYGKGTTFYLELPLAEDPQPTPQVSLEHGI